MWAMLQVSKEIFKQLCSELWPGKKRPAARGLECVEQGRGWYRFYVVSAGGQKQLTKILRHLWTHHAPMGRDAKSRKASRLVIEKMRGTATTPTHKAISKPLVVKKVNPQPPPKPSGRPVIVVNNEKPVRSLAEQMCDVLREILEEERASKGPATKARVKQLASVINQRFGHGSKS